jgi:hypothetical protein
VFRSRSELIDADDERVWSGSRVGTYCVSSVSAPALEVVQEADLMPGKSAHVKNEKQYEALKDKGMSKQRAAKIANSPNASKNGGKKSGGGGNAKQGGTTAQHKAAGRKGGKAAAKSHS